MQELPLFSDNVQVIAARQSLYWIEEAEVHNWHSAAEV
jgi:hypothetical protein